MNVLITGCSSGFGRLAALRFAAEGHTVFATMRDPEKGSDLRAAHEEKGYDIRVLALDITDQESVDSAVTEVVAAAIGIDVLVNNAGVELRGAVEEATDDEIRWQLDTNVLGTNRVTRAVVPWMRQAGGGAIVNVSSIAGVVSRPNGGWYSASKWALEAITEAMHYELAPWNIRVALVQPGSFPTELGSNARRPAAHDGGMYEERLAQFEAALAGLSGRGAKDSQQVAEVIYEAATTDTPRLRWLVGDDAEMIAAVRAASDFETFEAAIRDALDWHD